MTSHHQHQNFLRALIVVGIISAVDLTYGCSTNDTISSDDFHISCIKKTYRSVEIFCTGTNWAKFPVGKLEPVTVGLTFENCTIPADLSLLNITSKLGLKSVNKLRFERLHSGLSKTNLEGFNVETLEIIGADFVELPSDVLYSINPEDITIQNTQLEVLPEAFFDKSSDLRYLSIDYNRLKKLKRNHLAGLKVLRKVWLCGNQIEDIEPGSFDGLEDLRFLELSQNNLSTLHPDLFKKLSRMELLNIGRNYFNDLPKGLVRDIQNSRLREFRLGHNEGNLTTLPDGFFRNLNKLNKVELVNNQFTVLPSDLFLGAEGLNTLDLTDNDLVTLPPGIFNATYHLEVLNVSSNRLESLPDNIFYYPNLRVLALNNNQLTELTSGVVSGFSNLHILQMANNLLTYIHEDFCQNADELEEIDLSYNQLNLESRSALGQSIFTQCVTISKANFAFNNISQIFNDWSFGKLKELDLTHNKIKRITAYELSLLNYDANYNLTGNEITNVDVSRVIIQSDQFQNKYTRRPNRNAAIVLTSNPLNCDCKLSEFVEFMQDKYPRSVYNYIKFENDENDKLTCFKPDRLFGQPINQVDSNDLRCLIESKSANGACAGLCTCWEYTRKQTLYVDCSNRNLTSIPDEIHNPKNWSIALNMSGNQLRQTPSLIETSLVNVTSLDLSANNITSVTLDVFAPTLRDLKLHNNSIQRLDQKIIEYIYNDDEHLRSLTLHNNKWICDCEARHFLSAVQKKLYNFTLYKVACYDSGEVMHKMTTNELCEMTIAIIAIGCILVALFGIVVGTLSALYYKYQKEIKVWLYSKQLCLWFVTEDELDKDKQYDAFVSFSHKDEDFVEKELVAKLEEGPRPYKLCLHYRDWLAGEWIPAQIARSVEESRRTIVVLSPNFIESVWGRMEFRTAHSQALNEGRARVIVVLYGDVGNTEDLDPELKAYLSMNTYVKWGDPWFWDKLRYALPHRNELTGRRTRNTRNIDKHLALGPTSVSYNGNCAELLDHANEDEKMLATC